MSSESENPVHPGSGATTEEWLAYNKAGGRDLKFAKLNAESEDCRRLKRADLRFTDLRFADLSGAWLCYVDLRFADLRFANLDGADLTGAKLKGANLDGHDLDDLRKRGAKF